MPGAVYLGQMHVNWCLECNLPILERDRCRCGSETHQVKLTPPGDAFPASPGALEEIKGLLDSAYGPGVGDGLLPDDKLVLLNVLPAMDRALEIVLDGRVMGRNFYRPRKEKWVFKPTLEGAARISSLSHARRVTADPGAIKAVLKGASLLAPGITDADQSIQREDEVLLEDQEGRLIGVGRARMTGKEMLERDYGLACKVRRAERVTPTHILPGGQTWNDAVAANRGVLDEREAEAVNFIRNSARSHKEPKSVAFSGGKDSLCTLLLVEKAIDEFSIIFIDTGIEFPETVRYTESIIRNLGMEDKLIVGSAGERFWRAMDVFGPPSRDARWCCKVCKLGPTTQVIQNHLGGSCLTYVGQRKYESEQRKGRHRISNNPWVPGQISASPIRDWTALHVWLYIMREGADYNPLYDRGYSRIGCFPCPACDMAEFELLEDTHPGLAQKLHAHLDEHAQRSAMPPSWTERGLWRWRDAPNWADEHIQLESYIQVPEFKMEENDTGRFLYTKLDPDVVERAANLLGSLGRVREQGTTRIFDHQNPITLEEDGKLTIGPLDQSADIRKTITEVTTCLIKTEHCVGCATCVGVCPSEAIEIRDGEAWIGEGCTNCGRCIQLCPLLTWAVDIREGSADIFQLQDTEG